MEKLLEKEKRGSTRRWPVGLLAAALVASVSAAPNPNRTEAKTNPNAPSSPVSPVAKLKSSALDLPLAFEANQGQTDAKVKFLTRAQNFTVLLTPTETVMRGRNDDVLRMKLRNANQSPALVGEDKQLKVTNYYIGSDRSKWLEAVPNYGQVRYQEVYSGIDLVYHSDQRQLEYDFVVKPGADPDKIQIAFEGAKGIAITENGDLELKSLAGTSLHHKPFVYQVINGKRLPVQGEYALANNLVSFKLGKYDHTQPLVIDPYLRVLSFFGGVLNDEASGIAVSAVPKGAAVVFVGRSQSPSLPGAGTKPGTAFDWDAFATGLNTSVAGTTSIAWTTYFGGNGDDAARGVAMDNQGFVYVVGYTNSLNFPAGSAVNYDAFILKLSAGGGGIVGSTLYGGFLTDQGTSIALDYSTFACTAAPTATGCATLKTLGAAASILDPSRDPNVTPNVVIGGFTNGGIGQNGSPSVMVGKTPDGNQKNFNNCTEPSSTVTNAAIRSLGCGTTDGFVAIYDSNLNLLHHTYIGGGGNDQVNGVAVDNWGNVYATGFATPNVAPNFPVTRGIAPTSQLINGVSATAVRGSCNTNSTATGTGCWDAALVPQNAATSFVAKWACTTGNPAIGVPSPPFGWVGSPLANSPFPICAGGNNLNTLSNSALFGGSAKGGTWVNPQQTALTGVNATNGITDAALAIAVDQNGWGQTGVAGVAATSSVTPASGPPLPTVAGIPVPTPNSTGFPDLVPLESNNPCNLTAQGNNGLGAPDCAVSASNSATTGGFEPGLSGPHVYVAGITASRDFVNGLVFNASCTVAPFVSGPTPVPSLCPVPYVFGSAVAATGTLPTNVYCDPVAAGNCPTGATTADLRVKTFTNGNNSGQTQGWVASFQFPAVTQAVVTPPQGSQTTITTLNPPTIPNYIVLEPLTCPVAGSPGAATCINGAFTNPFTTASTATPNFGCTNPGPVVCTGTFLGSWNALTVDTDQQVYVIGQIGMNGAAGTFNTGAPTRLALDIERIGPYANTPGGSGVQQNICPSGNAPCAFPLQQFPFPTSPLVASADLIIDSLAAGTGIFNSNFGQILAGAPPFPDPNQPGGIGNGIAVSPLREAFFVGTSTELTAAGAAPPAPGATADLNGAGSVLDIKITSLGGSGYTTLPNCLISGGGGTGATCSLAAGGFTLDGSGNLVLPPAAGGVLPFTCSACVTAGGTGYTVPPTVTIAAPPATSAGSLTYLISNAALPPVPGLVPPFQGSVGQSGNAGESCGTPPCAGNGPEDVLFGAIQFFDAIANPSVVNFTATVNNFNSLTGPNGQTGSNAKAIVTYLNWQGQPLNIPPGCVVTPVVPPGPDGEPEFTVVPVNGAQNQFQITVNAIPGPPGSGTDLGPLFYPGVITSIITFTKSGNCTGIGVLLDSWDPITVTLTVSAPMNLSAEETFQITSGVGTGLVDQYVADGHQLVANQPVLTAVDVTTASAGEFPVGSAPINFTAQIVPGLNWQGSVQNAVIVPTPTDIIYAAGGPNFPARVPVQVNTQVIAGLPAGTYTAWIMFTASPETPVLPTSSSNACGPSTLPVASGTTSPQCIPIVIKIGSIVTANPATLNFGASTTPQQTQVNLSNPTGTPYIFSASYLPIPTFGTALPAANVFFVNTASTLIPAVLGATVNGTVPAGGVYSLPLQINPAGLPTGIYTGQVTFNTTTNGIPTCPASNPNCNPQTTPQTTTVPIIVYVGPHAGEDTPSGNGLGLMLPTNTFPIGTGLVSSVGSAPGSPGSYPLTLYVPSGVGPNGVHQIPNPTLIQVTGLNNVFTTAFNVNAPTASSSLQGAVSFTNVGQPFGGTLGGCNPTYGSLAAIPQSPLGPPCVWDIWVDATSLNSTNTTTQQGCPSVPGTNTPGPGITGTISFSAAGSSFPFSTLVVPLTVCVTDQPQLVLGMPNTFPNPTFGPTVGTGFGNCNSPGNPGGNSGNACQLATPSNLVPGFPQSITEMVLAISGGSSTATSVTSAPVVLQAVAGNSSQVCKVLDLHTNGGVISNVTVAPMGVQWATVVPLGSVVNPANAPAFLGPASPNPAPNSLPANSQLGGPFPFPAPTTGGPYPFPALGGFLDVGIAGLGWYDKGVGGNVFNTPGFAAGPVNIIPAMQTFAICGNTDPVGNASGIFNTTVTINGAGIGPIVVPVSLVVSPPGGSPPPAAAAKFSQIGIYRQGIFALDENGNNTFDLPGDRVVPFGLPGDIGVAGDWDGTGVVRIGVYRPSAGTWYLDMNNNGKWDGTGPGLDAAIQFGSPTNSCNPTSAAGLAACLDIPVVGDWNGNGVTKLGIFRGSAGQFYLDNQNPTQTGFNVSHTSWTTGNFGQAGDIPVAANWGGAGGGATTCPVPANGPVVEACDQVGVYRKGTWYANYNGTGTFNPATDLPGFNFGSAGDFPVTGNWNGTGSTPNAKRIGVLSGAGVWYVDINNDHVFTQPPDQIFNNFGQPGDLPVVGGAWSLP